MERIVHKSKSFKEAQDWDIEQAFAAYRGRRFERCKYIVDASLRICAAQVAGEHVDQSGPTREMFEVVARPI